MTGEFASPGHTAGASPPLFFFSLSLCVCVSQALSLHRWVDYYQDILVERGLVQEHPDFPDGLINPSPLPRLRKPAPEPDNQTVPESTLGEGLVLTLGSTGEGADAAGGERNLAHESRDPSTEKQEEQEVEVETAAEAEAKAEEAEEEDEEDEEEGTVVARVGATLESDPADVLQQG